MMRHDRWVHKIYLIVFIGLAKAQEGILRIFEEKASGLARSTC